MHQPGFDSQDYSVIAIFNDHDDHDDHKEDHDQCHGLVV